MLLKDYLFYYQKNLINLNSAISQANDELTIDGTIKSFELTYELVWKTMKRYLEVREINIHKIQYKKLLLIQILEANYVKIYNRTL